MRSLSEAASRHVVIDRRAGHYICFPDILRTSSGRLVTAYTEADQHGRTRQKLLCRTSDDGGRSWSGPRILHPALGQCPRLAETSDGQLMCIDDQSYQLFWSLDDGARWAGAQTAGLQHSMMDRPIELDVNTFLTAGHIHRGICPQPGIRQAPPEVMAYLSRDRGTSWQPLSVISADKHLALCEVSICRLEDGRLLALMRENSFVYEPMYLSFSADNGKTWSDPRPTPLVGHRPTIAPTKSGKLLITYRNVGPNGSTSAWLGTLDELQNDFQVHGLSPIAPAPGPDGLLLRSGGGRATPLRYALRPLSDPRHAKAVLEARLKVLSSEENGFAIRFGGIWWRMRPDHILPDAGGVSPISIPAGEMVSLRFEYDSGSVKLLLDGKKVAKLKTDREKAEARPILLGNADMKEQNGAEAVLHSLGLTIKEPRLMRRYAWQWKHTDGVPDAYVQARVLELKNARLAHFGDYGYSGWAEVEPGRFLCVYHHADADVPDYKPDFQSYVMGTFFDEGDFR